MTYATYAYYVGTYGGNSIPESEFPKYAKKASAEIDHVTFGRLKRKTDDEIPDEVRDAVCDVAERMHKISTIEEEGNYASENNDGYSVSYRDIGDSISQQRDIHTTIRTYLAVTGLMFRGVRDDDWS